MLWMKGVLWLLTELFLTLVELDHLADYSEYIFRFRHDLDLQRDRMERVLCAEGIHHRACLTQPAAVLAEMTAVGLPTAA
ncbi:MAG TPA: hypothetical protein IGR64_06185 [Leptolyngbyaceae cyanobacterium M65_K2018_010]|nr:hypothetical protein [Leptolyngbyaceae cyanobacterium M65_K2018_010]